MGMVKRSRKLLELLVKSQQARLYSFCNFTSPHLICYLYLFTTAGLTL